MAVADREKAGEGAKAAAMAGRAKRARVNFMVVRYREWIVIARGDVTYISEERGHAPACSTRVELVGGAAATHGQHFCFESQSTYLFTRLMLKEPHTRRLWYK